MAPSPEDDDGGEKPAKIFDGFYIALLIFCALMTVASTIWPDNFAHVYPYYLKIDMFGPASRIIRFFSQDLAIGTLHIPDITRALSQVVAWPLLLLQGILADGSMLEFPGMGSLSLPVLPWASLTVAVAVFSHWCGGFRLAGLTLGTLFYFAALGLWSSAMYTLSAIVVAVACGVAIGTLFGVAAFRSQRFESVVSPIYDTLQTLPVFSYLVPLVVFFGLGPVTALLATIIYATPPMARVTTLALREAPPSLSEFAQMAGCSVRQETWRVMLPSRMRDLLLGVNQVIMLSLATVVIASTIGAGGLGNDVLRALKSLRFGQALGAGLGITLMAISFDQISRALAGRRPVHASQSIWTRHGHLIVGALGMAIVSFFAFLIPELRQFPESWQVTSTNIVGDAVTAFNRSHAVGISAFRDWMTVDVMRPVRDLFLGLPWLVVILLTAAAGTALRGIWTGVAIFSALLLIAIAGLWSYAMLSLYLVLTASVIGVLIGIPLGILAASSTASGKVIGMAVDTLQTLPAFVYLVPAVVLFSVGELPALLSITLYALAPSIRYTQQGLRSTEPSVLEAAAMAGATRLQVLLRVQLPLAMPFIILGFSQTLVMAFSMLSITSLVGSRGLEILTLEALGKVDPGKGLVAGMGIVVLTIVTDRLISGVADRWNWRVAKARSAEQ